MKYNGKFQKEWKTSKQKKLLAKKKAKSDRKLNYTKHKDRVAKLRDSKATLDTLHLQGNLSLLIDVKVGKRRKIGTTFIYKGIKLEVVEQYQINKCKDCYFYNRQLFDTSLINDCANNRDINITGVCFHNIIFIKYEH